MATAINYQNLPAGFTVLITGATDGIGKETALILASLGANVILHGRNSIKLTNVHNEIKKVTGNGSISSVLADFSSLQQVKQMAEEVRSRFSHLDVLINNAGIFSQKLEHSVDGFELTFEVNYLSSFLLTNLLAPLLIQSAPARIINLSSISHRLVTVDPNHLQQSRIYWAWVAYARSKLLLVLFSNTLARKLERLGVTSNAIHPGIIPGTNVSNMRWVRFQTSRRDGARAIVNLAINPALAGMTGAYFSKFDQCKPNPITVNQKLQNILWKKSLEWTKDQLTIEY